MPSRFLVTAIDFRMPARSGRPTKSSSVDYLSAPSAQPQIFPTTKSRNMGAVSQDLHLISRSNSSFGSGTCAELANPSFLEKIQFWGDRGLALWATLGNNKLVVYQGSWSGRADESKISSCVEPAKERSPSEGVDECSFLFREGNKAIKCALEQTEEEKGETVETKKTPKERRKGNASQMKQKENRKILEKICRGMERAEGKWEK